MTALERKPSPWALSQWGVDREFIPHWRGTTVWPLWEGGGSLSNGYGRKLGDIRGTLTNGMTFMGEGLECGTVIDTQRFRVSAADPTHKIDYGTWGVFCFPREWGGAGSRPIGYVTHGTTGGTNWGIRGYDGASLRAMARESSAGNFEAIWSTSPAVNVRMLIGGSYEGPTSVLRLWVDGEQKAVNSSIPNNPLSVGESWPMILGSTGDNNHDANDGGRSFDGLIYYAFISNRVWTPRMWAVLGADPMGLIRKAERREHRYQRVRQTILRKTLRGR
jgi:hypothetical protein